MRNTGPKSLGTHGSAPACFLRTIVSELARGPLAAFVRSACECRQPYGSAELTYIEDAHDVLVYGTARAFARRCASAFRKRCHLLRTLRQVSLRQPSTPLAGHAARYSDQHVLQNPDVLRLAVVTLVTGKSTQKRTVSRLLPLGVLPPPRPLSFDPLSFPFASKPRRLRHSSSHKAQSPRAPTPPLREPARCLRGRSLRMLCGTTGKRWPPARSLTYARSSRWYRCGSTTGLTLRWNRRCRRLRAR